MRDARREFFRDVHSGRRWPSEQSVSGFGSDTAFTRELVSGLPGLLRRLEVRSLLDIPCGDFFWMKELDLSEIRYLGADIVPEIVAANAARFQRPGTRFAVMDLVTDPLPAVDMVFVRDCFIHFTNELIFQALHNIVRSRSRYLCMTHDPCDARYASVDECNIELDRAVNGVNSEFRPLHFGLPPFGFPPPVDMVRDGPAWDGCKVMAVWPLDSIATALRALAARSSVHR